MAQIDPYLEQILKRRGSDLHFIAGDPARIRLHGELSPLQETPLAADSVKATLYEIMPRKAVERFEKKDGADFAYTLEGKGRFRVNVMRQLNGMGAVFRAIPSQALTLDQLDMPAAVRQLCRANNGLILVTGKTGSGKSTSLASMIDDINKRERGHILTVEDPIEFVHARRNCLVSQREIGVHAESFASALHSALREDPDVILVGELRDLETMSIAVTAAEMGILVMGTLHTNGAAQTVDRMVNQFPADKQPHVRTMLSTSLRGVVSQQLLKRADGSGRVAALEILINTSATANLIRQGKLDQLETSMQSGGQFGMRTMDSAIQALLDAGAITGAEAFRKAINKPRFEAGRHQGEPTLRAHAPRIHDRLALHAACRGTRLSPVARRGGQSDSASFVPERSEGAADAVLLGFRLCMYQLYIANKNYSSWSLRPWVLMQELGIGFDEHLLSFGDTDAWEAYRTLCPSGKVPCLLDGDTVVWDSLSISEYLAERHAGVWPQSAAARAWARSAAAEMHAGFGALREQCSMNCGARVRLHAHAPALEQDLARLAALWSDGLRRFGGPFLAGAQFSAADAFFAPVAFRLQTYGLTLPEPADAYARRLLERRALRTWYLAALDEPMRDASHERAIARYGQVVQDLRESA